ncbi:ABC transporter ATP-binding protein [Bombiscardovia apis]|uniref:ABC transporter ATP-binding protein n=1 Tax=Bombiscardovia apis TaxID=2932182 RepID=A0ABM8BDK2_9BIFI|nr:ABC transporter ATP-binding protein [Bombiscardovia apis]BDR54970.1 ABC transporter ATP-binding protein [Bombiscardovia apis]
MSLTLTNVTKSYRGKSALDRVSLDLQTGLIYGLFGRNGAGKTTLLNVIADRLKADSGMMLVDGKRLEDCGSLQRRIALVDGTWPYPAYATVRRCLRLAQTLYGDFDWAFADRMLNAFGIESTRRFSSLSLGQRQEVKATLALSLPADYVLLDESTNGVDAAGRKLIYRFILEAYEQRERAILISTHIISEIEGLINQAYVLDQGRLVSSFDLEGLPGMGYGLIGRPEQIDPYLRSRGSRVLSRQKLGQMIQVGVAGDLPSDLPQGVLSQALDLQTYCIYLTEGGQL